LRISRSREDPVSSHHPSSLNAQPCQEPSLKPAAGGGGWGARLNASVIKQKKQPGCVAYMQPLAGLVHWSTEKPGMTGVISAGLEGFIDKTHMASRNCNIDTTTVNPQLLAMSNASRKRGHLFQTSQLVTQPWVGWMDAIGC